jgi:hypothetical protein
MESSTDMKLLHKIINCFPFQKYQNKKYCLFPCKFNYKSIRRQLKNVDNSFQISYTEKFSQRGTPQATNDCLIILKRHLEKNGYQLIDVKRQINDEFFHYCRLSSRFPFKAPVSHLTIYFD